MMNRPGSWNAPDCRRLVLERLEQRALLAADLVIEWNNAALAAIRADNTSRRWHRGDLAILHTAIYDAVNAIDSHRTRSMPLTCWPREHLARGGGSLAATIPCSAPYFPRDQADFDAIRGGLGGDSRRTTESLGLACETTLLSDVAVRANDGSATVLSYTPGRSRAIGLRRRRPLHRRSCPTGPTSRRLP